MKSRFIELLVVAAGALLLMGGPLAVAAESMPGSADDLANIDQMVDRADRFFAAGEIDRALELYEEAGLLAENSADSEAVHALTYIRGQQGNAYWAAFEETHSVDSLWVALYYWETERDLYQAFNYPEGFVSLALMDVGRAHLALAMREDLQSHLGHAAAALQAARTSLPKEGMGAIQFLLRLKYGGPEVTGATEYLSLLN